MNLLKNKYFLLGNLAFLLLVIPVALFLLKNQTKTRGSAAPTTTLSFSTATLTTDQCTTTSQTNLILNPGQNVVSTVDLTLKWDKSKFDITFNPGPSFPQILKGPDQLSDGLHITLNIGADVTKAIVATTTVGTITIKPVSPTTGSTPLSVDPVATKVYSLAQSDGATENVYNASGSTPLAVTISPKVCEGASVSPTVAISPTALPTLAVTPTTGAANIPPTCLTLSGSVSSGSAPLSVTLTGTGNDTDGTINKATFNFGDGTVSDVTTGLGLAAASSQLAHTYTVGGDYSSTVTFTDNGGAISNACTQLISVSGTSATATPTTGIAPTEIPTATPTIAPSGNISSIFGVIGGIMLVIAAGIFLLAL